MKGGSVVAQRPSKPCPSEKIRRVRKKCKKKGAMENAFSEPFKRFFFFQELLLTQRATLNRAVVKLKGFNKIFKTQRGTREETHENMTNS